MSSADHVSGPAGGFKATRLPELMLVLVAALWGLTFLGTQFTLRFGGAVELVAWRFGIATLMLVAINLRHVRGLTRAEVKAGLLVGLPMAAGYVLQTEGLNSIESSRSAFFTALYVVLVPLAQALLLRRAPSRVTWVGALFAFGGLTMMSVGEGGGWGLGRGEILTLLGTLAITAEILVVGMFAPAVDPRRFALVQMAVVAVLSFLLQPVVDAQVTLPSQELLLGATVLGAGSVIIQVGISWAQRTVSQSRAAVIYATEPVWAGAVGYAAGERMGASAFVGAFLILSGILACISRADIRAEREPQARGPRSAAPTI